MKAAANRETGGPSSLRLVLTLAIAGLISGIAIIGIYESTLPTITANKARELREAVEACASSWAPPAMQHGGRQAVEIAPRLPRSSFRPRQAVPPVEV